MLRLFTLATFVVACLGADFCDNDNRSGEIESFTNGANDVVVVVQPDGTLRATDFHVQGLFLDKSYCVQIYKTCTKIIWNSTPDTSKTSVLHCTMRHPLREIFHCTRYNTACSYCALSIGT